jgi:hypothetical protein
MHLVVDRDEPPVDRDGGGLLVEVLPAEPEELVAAHPGEGCSPEGREEAVPGRGAQKGPQLLRRPGTPFDPGDGPKAGGVGDQGNVPRDEPATHGFLESPPDDQVDLVHRLRSERGVSVARMEQAVVESVEVVRTQAPQADVAECGDDVVLDVVTVAVVGACGEDKAFAWQPPAAEEGPEAQ